MPKKLIIIGIALILVSIGFSGCNEEDLKTLCDETKATPIVVTLEITFHFVPSIKAESFNKANTDGYSKWWFSKTVNKCGVGGTDYTMDEKVATFDNVQGDCKFSVPVYLDNEIDEVFIEGGLNHGGSTFYTSKFLGYKELSYWGGGTYKDTLKVGETTTVTPVIKAQLVFTEGFNYNQTVRFDVTTPTNSYTYDKVTKGSTGETEPLYLNLVDFSTTNKIDIVATHQGTGKSAYINITSDCLANQYYDFVKGKNMVDVLIYIKLDELR